MKPTTRHLVFVGLLLLVCAIFYYVYFYFLSDEPDHVRNILYSLGIIGGAIGIYLAVERQKTFSNQIQTAQDQVKLGQNQLYLDQLGRGVDNLAHEESMIRIAGIRVLEDLALTSGDDELIRNILYEFLKSLAYIKHPTSIRDVVLPGSSQYDDFEKNREAIHTAADALIKLTSESKNNKHLSFYNLDLRGFTIPPIENKGMDLRFIGCRMKSVYFSSGPSVQNEDLSLWNKLDFWGSNLTEGDFSCVDLSKSNFSKTILIKADFGEATLTGAQFISANLEDADFTGADCTGANFKNVENLNNDLFSNIIFEKANPPKHLPENIVLPTKGAY